MQSGMDERVRWPVGGFGRWDAIGLSGCRQLLRHDVGVYVPMIAGTQSEMDGSLGGSGCRVEMFAGMRQGLAWMLRGCSWSLGRDIGMQVGTITGT